MADRRSQIMGRLTPHVSRLTSHASRITFYVLRYPDILIGLTLFMAGLYAYTITLAPTVLEGDAALFQYTPYILGVTYPTGYPLYILLGKLWVTLFPFGEIAWRMNLFSAVCSAATLPLIYGAARRLLAPAPIAPEQKRPEKLISPSTEKTTEPTTRGFLLPTPYFLLPDFQDRWIAPWSALAVVLTFATLPTFWRWSTEAKIYALNILLFSGVLYTLTLAYTWGRGSGVGGQVLSTSPHASRLTSYASRLALPALLLGLELTVHSTTVLLIPGLLLFAWLNLREYLLDKKSLISNLLLLFLPGLLYLYIPLRAEWLIAQYGRDEAIMHGLLADFYHSGLAGWVRYFTAANFTGGVVTNWDLVPQQFLTVYIPLLRDELTPLGIGLGIVGGLTLAINHPRIFWPLFLVYTLPIPFVLTYGQGEQSAFLLPSFLIFSIFVGNALLFITRVACYILRFTPHASRLTPHASRFTPPLLSLALIFLLFLPQTRSNINWLQSKWDRANYEYWADALAHPLTPGAAVLAQWGDLTPFWYMQYAESRRPDLRGLYPPSAEMVTDYLNSKDNEVYIAGPSSKEWAAGIEEDYQLIPWGRLVRIVPKTIDPQMALPSLPHPSEAIFDNKLRLLGVDYPPQAVDGGPYGVTLTWQALTDLPPETTFSLRLSQGEMIAAQLDDTLLSGWFPRDTLPSGQYVLSYVPIPIRLGTLPGKYRLQLVVYVSYKQPWPLADGTTLLDLGEVELILPPAGTQPDSTSLNPSSGYDFNGEIKLVDYEYTVSRVGQGKGFGVKLLWQAQTQPVDNYILLAELVDREDQVLRSVQQPPVEGRAPTASWQPGQYVRDQVDLVLPASAPVGQQAVQVRLSWLRLGGSKLPLRRWLLPAGDTLDLDWLEVTEKEERIFTVPPVQYPVDANLDNKVRLIGYNASLPQESRLKSGLQFSQSACAADAEACQVHFDFIWQGLNEMDQLYFVFLHLVDEQGQMVAQQDKGPGIRGKEPTTSWLPGEVVADPVDLTLRSDLPPGRYKLRIGMYLPPAGPRLPVLDKDEQTVGEFVEIGVIEVIP